MNLLIVFEVSPPQARKIWTFMHYFWDFLLSESNFKRIFSKFPEKLYVRTFSPGRSTYNFSKNCMYIYILKKTLSQRVSRPLRWRCCLCGLCGPVQAVWVAGGAGWRPAPPVWAVPAVQHMVAVSYKCPCTAPLPEAVLTPLSSPTPQKTTYLAPPAQNLVASFFN